MAQYFTEEFKREIDPYIAPLSPEEKEQYYREGEESIRIRSGEGIAPSAYLDLIRGIGTYLAATTGPRFMAEYQTIRITDSVTFYSFQLPGGGNLNLFVAPEGKLVLDTGYAAYYQDCAAMLKAIGLNGFDDVIQVVCTHGDADHCGACGYFPVVPLMHPVTKALLESGTRNYGSENSLDLLEKFYTTSINTMTRMHISEEIAVTGTEPIGNRGLFPIIGHVSFAGMQFEIWESLGGHIAGQLLLYEPTLGMLFTSDAFINFATLSKERADYCSIADSMIGSVNVNSEIARKERKELIRLAAGLDAELHERGRRLLICCGHGAVSVLENGNLVPAAELQVYRASP